MSRRKNPAEELIRRTAHRETFRNVAHQLQCLKRCYNVLYGVTTDIASNNQVERVSPQQQPNSRAFILRKLKYALRAQYEDCFPLPPPDRCTVLLLFDTNEEAFFEIRLKPKAWPEDWPTRFDCGSAGIDVELYSLAIYMKVLEAFNEEEAEAENGGTGDFLSEPPRVFGVVNSSGTGDGPRSSVEENGLIRVIVKSEEEEIVISDEEEEEAAENNVHANEQVNSSGNQLPFSNTVKQEPTEHNSNISLITRKRPLESTSSSALQNPLPFPPPAAAAAMAPQTRARDRVLPAAFASSSHHLLNNSSRSRRSPVEMNEMIAVADRFTASSAYQSFSGHYLLSCPLCSRLITKRYMTDHLNAVHLGRRYHCAWPGCAKAFSYRHIGHKHLKQAHKSTAYEQYLQCRE